jgi:hypothetical protein
MSEPKNEAVHTEHSLDTKDAEIVLESGKAETVLHDDYEIDPVFEKKTMYVTPRPPRCQSTIAHLLHRRKVDIRLLPITTAIYAFSLIDRTNYGGARIAGMDEALRLDVGERASIACEFAIKASHSSSLTHIPQ